MIRMYPKAAVLTVNHPFGATEKMAQSLSCALIASGYDTQIFNINDASLQRLPQSLRDPDFRLIITTGTMPLYITIDNKPIWEMIGPQAQFITYIIDAWPYDYVLAKPCRDYLQARRTNPNLHIASVEGNDCRLIGQGVHFMPTGAYLAPWRRGPKENNDRLMIWASVNKELAVTALHNEFETTLIDNNVWGFDSDRVRTICEALRYTTIIHGMSALADAMGIPVAELVVPDYMTALCAMDSCLKRYRRVKVVMALRGFPVDIYGENWDQYVGNERSFRLLTPNPNQNYTFSYLVQHYAGLVNFDPNFGCGTNERAISALAMGIPISNNFNITSDHLAGVYPYHFTSESIRFSVSNLLSHTEFVPTPNGSNWEFLVSRLLRSIATSGAN